MANTIRITPESGSITFARDISSISASISGAPQVSLNVDAAGELSVVQDGTNVVTFTPTDVSFPNTSKVTIPVVTAAPPGAAVGTLYINSGNNTIAAVGNSGPVTVIGTKGDTGAKGSQGPIGPKGQKGGQGPAGPKGQKGPQEDKVQKVVKVLLVPKAKKVIQEDKVQPDPKVLLVVKDH